MKTYPLYFSLLIVNLVLTFAGYSQHSTDQGLFTSNDVLTMELKGNMHQLMNDRSGVPKSYPLVLVYKTDEGIADSIRVSVKTRGHFRRAKGNCDYPPLLLQFPGQPATSIFNKVTRLKLVMPCQGDEYVIKEWLAYKLYNLVTNESFKAKLVMLSLKDEDSKKHPVPFYGMLLEDEKQMAKRNHQVAVTRKMNPEQTQRGNFLTMAVFEYLIGNTDWSVQYQQNIKLVAADSTAPVLTVPYDFDHAGIVNATYALPAEELEMSSVRERRYRGYCIQDMSAFDSTVALYNRLKKDIVALYTDCPLLDKRYVKTTLQYVDQFYETINDPKLLKKEFGYPCRKDGTGNVIIKGLKND